MGVGEGVGSASASSSDLTELELKVPRIVLLGGPYYHKKIMYSQTRIPHLSFYNPLLQGILERDRFRCYRESRKLRRITKDKTLL